MLYMVVSHYREGWWQSYIANEGDDGLKHHFVFDVDAATAGEAQIRLDHYHARMYPYGTKTGKVMTLYVLFKWDPVTKKYVQVQQDFGSDWIGY